MMKSIIICEGKTDAIILSYYLGKVKGWKYNVNKNNKTNIPIRNKETEEANWYKLNEDMLAIWAVGGKDNFGHAISSIMQLNRIANEEDAFDKVVILMDRDKADNDEEILNGIAACFEEGKCSLELKNCEWSDGVYRNEFDDEMRLKCLSLIIPFDKNGALETFLLDAMAELGEEEKKLIEECRSFIDGFELEKYLNTQRLRVKGELSSALAVMYPDKVFTPINEMLVSIPWEEYNSVRECFVKLEEI